MDPGKLPNFSDILRSWFPCFFCWKPSRRDRAFKKARDMLEDEVNVYRVIQTRRFFSQVIKELLPVAKRREMQQISESIVIDPDSESEPEVSDQDRSGD
mmetsp:Transcript_35517/g.43512  ORF Transcript_35517/g.43512 Transcript_35517/m.43512 type:complete len:99 (+) Transcript_35517:1249-1545(+)